MNNDSLPVIFVTSNDTEKERKKGFELGAANFIVKPFAKGELLTAVNMILNPSETLRDMTVLVVDDSFTARRFVTTSLNQLGVIIHETDDGSKAYEILKENSDIIDVVITDLDMPEMDGEELLRKMRHELGLKDIPVIVLTANNDQETLLNLFRAGSMRLFC